jgi:hypothetical protein
MKKCFLVLALMITISSLSIGQRPLQAQKKLFYQIGIIDSIIILDGQSRIVIALLKINQLNQKRDSLIGGEYHAIFAAKHKKLAAEADSLINRLEALVKRRDNK